MDLKTDDNGFEYLERLPDGWRRASIEDFTVNGKRKIGMKFLIKWIIREDYYQVCTVGNTLTREKLEPFITIGRVFIKDESDGI